MTRYPGLARAGSESRFPSTCSPSRLGERSGTDRHLEEFIGWGRAGSSFSCFARAEYTAQELVDGVRSVAPAGLVDLASSPGSPRRLDYGLGPSAGPSRGMAYISPLGVPLLGDLVTGNRDSVVLPSGFET
jgi:hypothetical protein